MNLDSYRAWPPLPAMCFEVAARDSGKPLLRAKTGG